MRLLQQFGDRFNEVVYYNSLCLSVFCNLGTDLGVLVGLTEFEPDVLHLRLNAVESKAVGQRDEDIHCLTENLILFPLRHRLYSAQIMKAVCQFNKYDSYVIIQRKKYPFEVLCLKRSLLLSPLHLGIHCRLDLCKTVYQRGYLAAK